MTSENLGVLFRYFEDIDMPMDRVYYEASVSIDSLNDTDYKFASLIENEKLVTFADLINHE